MTDNPTPFAGARLLVVDDNDLAAELAAGMLELLGVRTLVALDGAQAVAILAADASFDGVLMDCEMPGLDGYDATRAIRQLPAVRPDLAILAMTGNDRPEDLARILACGMNGRITKPLTLAKLTAELTRWIRPAGNTKGDANGSDTAQPEGSGISSNRATVLP